MNRDMNVVRAIVLAVADMPEGRTLSALDGVSEAVFAAHAQWLTEAGLLHAAIMQEGKRPATKATIWRLTWDGCDFADSIRSDTLWRKAVDTVIVPSASWSFGILRDWLKTQIALQLGI